VANNEYEPSGGDEEARHPYQDQLEEYLASMGEEFEPDHVQRRRLAQYLHGLGRREGRGGGAGFYPGATVPNDQAEGAAPTDTPAAREFGLVKQLRRVTMDTAVEALRGVQRLKDAEAARGRGGFGYGGRPANDGPSVGFGDILFELGAAHVRTWQQLLKVTRAYGDSWMGEPGSPRVAVGGWEVVELEPIGDERGWHGDFTLRNASPMQVSVAWPETVEFIQRQANGEVLRREARLRFLPRVAGLEAYERAEGIVVTADPGDEGFPRGGTWSAGTAVRLADLVDLALTLRLTIEADEEAEE